MHRFLFLMPSLGDIAQELARVSYAYRAPILLISAAMSATFAAIMLSSREARRLAGSWVKYIGWAFLAYSFQYFFRLVGWFLQQDVSPLQATLNFLANLCSGLTNFFFLAAALILLSKGGRLLLNLRGDIKAVRLLRSDVAVPTTLIVLTPAVLTTVTNFYFVETASPWAASLARLPDAIISAFCLSLLGYAMMRNFITHHRRYLAVVVLYVGLLYGFVQLIYAFTPIWAAAQRTEILAVLQSVPGPRSGETGQFLDSVIFTVALPLKMLLFVPAVYLFFTLVIAAHDFRKVLRVVTERKRSYLSSGGIVEAIGQSLSADRVELFIRLPGGEPPRAWCIMWPPEAELSDYPLLLEEGADPRLLGVFKGGGQIPPRQNSETPPKDLGRQVMLPVKFQGAVVGCLKVTFRHRRRVTYAALQQLRSVADLLALAVNEYRALASLDQLSYRFARLLVRMQSTHLGETTREMAVILHDVLSPLATRLILKAGFRPNQIFIGADELRGVLDEQAARDEAHDLSARVLNVAVGGAREEKVYTNQLIVTPREVSLNSFSIGSLTLVLPGQCDEVGRPTLGEYDLHRRAIASHTADALLDLVRAHLSVELNELSINLNADTLTRDEWLASIQRMARGVGLLWTGLTQGESSEVLGEPKFAEFIYQGGGKESGDAPEAPPISLFPFHDEVTGTRQVLRIELKQSGHQVWFGVAHEGFGPELDFPSPWRSFLEDFRDIADSSLSTLIESEKAKERVARMAEELAVMNIALTTGHLMHQLANSVDDQLFPAESLWDAAARGDLKTDEAQRAQLEAILNSARVMKSLISIFKNVTGTNLQRPCSLRKVVVQALKFQERVGQSGVRFKNKVVDEDYLIDVPYNVAVFAVANLIGNSKDAISERRRQAGEGYLGEICLEARSAREEVICYVEDNGSGIPQHIREKLYTLGQSGKPTHNGWGLYFTKHSLGENGASIELVETMPGRTKFRLKFPKARGAR